MRYGAGMHTPVTIQRTSFFRGPRGTLRFAEEEGALRCEHPHVDCNCTKTVDVRPPGEPEQVSQMVLFQSKRDIGQPAELLVDLTRPTPRDASLRWTFTWGESDESFAPGLGRTPHAYFWFSQLERHVHVCVIPKVRPIDEIMKLGRLESDGFFAMLYMGNRIDTSEFFHGHSPSRVVDLGKIDEREVWLHYAYDIAHGGNEPMLTLAGDEAEHWRRVFDETQKIGPRAEPYWRDTTTPLDDVYAQVAADELLAEQVERVTIWLQDVVKNGTRTQIGRWWASRHA